MPIPFSEYFARVQECLERTYGIRVKMRGIPEPLIGDLDGLEIHIDPACNSEQRLFLAAHLFGHTAQWNVNPGAFELGGRYRPPVENSDIPAILDYEREAAAFALEMLHEAGIKDIDQWFSDYAACDETYLLHYYRTGEKGEFHSFWHDNVPLVQPKPVPRFTPTRRRFRMEGVVI
ncbi:MAG: hypothetical protein ABSF46_18250 [Terriglobia bacterium]